MTIQTKLFPALFMTLTLGSLGGCTDALDSDGAPDPAAGELDASPATSVFGGGAFGGGEGQQAINSSSPQCKGVGRPVIVKGVGGDCTVPGIDRNDWETSNLFVDGSPAVLGLSLPTPASMANYCRYTYIGDPLQYEAAYDELGVLVGAAANLDITTAGFDCRAFAGEAPPDPMAADVIDALHDSFMANIDALDGAELANLALSPVETRVVDSIHEAALQPNDTLPAHGLRLEGIIDDIACAGDATCSSQIQQVLALPRRPWGDDPFANDVADWDRGGHVGYWSDLALGIYTAVQGWRELNVGLPEHRRLVINISLGGAPETGLDGTGPTDAVVDALTMAACYGAIVVTSAGNRSDMSCASETGMLAPGVFESIPRPTESECAALGFVPDWDTNAFPVFDPSPTAHPLVWAIAGVDGHDDNIANGRADSFSRIVAAGANGVASGDTPYPFPIDDVVMTGTSVSAAVASATAKNVWGYDPSLRPDEVMQRIYDGGYDIGEQAVGFYAGQAVRRLSVCGALEAAGALVPGCVVGPPDQNANLDGYVAAMDALVLTAEAEGQAVTIDNQEPIDAAPACEAPVLYPGVEPMPEKPTCSICGIETNDPDANGEESLKMSMTWVGEGPPAYITMGLVYLYDGYGQASTLVIDEDTRAALNLDPAKKVVIMNFDLPSTVMGILELHYDNGEIETSVLDVY